MASSRPRNPCSFSNLLLTSLNLIIFILSLLSLSLTIILKTPPSPLGLAFLIISSLSLLFSFLGLFSLPHIFLFLASSIAQLFAFLYLFFKEKQSLSLFRSPRDPRETKLLVRIECGFFFVMFVLQVFVIVMSWAVGRCWKREMKEGEREADEKKRGIQLSKVYEESVANMEKSKEVKDKEFDEKMKKKYGHWVKTDFQEV